MVLSAVALVLVAAANVQVARERDGVDQDLARARVAADRVSDHLVIGNLDALDADLDLLTRSGIAARTGSTGLDWAVADRADLGPAQVRGLRRQTALIAELATAARSLRENLTPLAVSPGGASMTGPEGPNGLYALDDLARAWNEYATTAERIADPTAEEAGRAALAAGLLPALAGADGPRIWTICRRTGGPCVRITVTNARSGAPTRAKVSTRSPGSVAPPGRRWTAGIDVLVVGIDPATLFPERGSFGTAAVFDLLLHLDRTRSLESTQPAPSAQSPVELHSAIGTEQQAIDQLGGS